MANRKLLLCLVVLSISLACYFESAVGSPKRGGSSAWLSSRSKPSYPSSGGLSTYGPSKHSYPSSTGLSGSGSGSSWSSWNSKPSYPSWGGLSRNGTGSGSSSYTGTGGNSSSNSGSSWSWWNSISSSNNYYGTPSYHDHGTSHQSGTHGTSQHSETHVVDNQVTNLFSTPYHSSPQYVYVTDYRNSGSRYSDLLTGLTLYNMGRSQSDYHRDYFYHDDYYRRRYNSDSSVNSNYSPQKTAVCTMRITEDGKVETLMIPCEIVSTFTNEGEQYTIPQSQVNTTTCVTNSTLMNNTSPDNMTSVNSTLSSDVTTVSCTTCTFSVVATDPLKVKGPPLNSSNMQCEVEIRTSELRTTNKVDCDTLLRYSKMPEPKQNNFTSPEKQTLLQKPPWWIALFIAV